MGKAEKSAVKRLGRGAVSIIISGVVGYLTGKPYLVVMTPVINAIGKWLRDKFGLTHIPI